MIGEVGDASANKAINKRIAQDFQQAEVSSIPVMLFILVLAFGALVAAGVPLLLGITAVAAALGITELISHLLHVDPSIQEVILLIGLAVGIDYSLFYLRREREERAKGRAPAEALQVAAATSGRAVLISGLTVIIAMTGMFLMGNQTFTSFGIGTVLVVAIALVGSLTVLPAVLSKLGDRVDRGRIPFCTAVAHGTDNRACGRRSSTGFCAGRCSGVERQRRCWWRWRSRLQPAHGQLGHPRAAAGPDRGQGLQPRPGEVPRRWRTGRGRDQRPRRDHTPSHRRDRRVKRAALATGVMHEPISVDISASHQAARVFIGLTGNGTDSASNRALERLRSSVIPATIGKVPASPSTPPASPPGRWTSTTR